MAKKDFKTTGNNTGFFSGETIAKKDGNPKTEKKAPKGNKKEKRERRVQLVLPSSLYEDLKTYADENYLSVNQSIINAIVSLLDK